MIEYNKLYKWQKDAIGAWIKKNFRGTVVSPTGGGKTLFALYCIQKLKTSTFIVVPTEVLMHQWKNEMIKNLDISEKDIGLYYGKSKELKKYTIGIINSASKADLSFYNFLIMDEVHRYSSSENIKIIKNNRFKYTLGVTATLIRKDSRERLLEPLIGSNFYTYRMDEAIKDDVLSNFEVINVSTTLTEIEKLEYDTVNDYIIENFKYFNYNFLKIQKTISDTSLEWKKRAKAIKLIKMFNQRRKIYNNSENKIIKTIEIIKNHLSDKIIVFSQSINFANKIYEKCKNDNLNVEIYHSKNKNIESINKFSSSKSGILISVMSLNEGLNVKDANIGIILGGFNVFKGKERVLTQRLGRILRKKENNSKAILYQIYSKETKDATDTYKRRNMLKKLNEKINNK